MTDMEQRAAAKAFVADWQGRGDEKQDTQSFWLALLQKVYGVAEPEKYIRFEVRVKTTILTSSMDLSKKRMYLSSKRATE